VIDSIRNPSEVEELRKLPGFYFVAIDAPVELRYERERERGRVGAATTLEQFVELEKLERSTDPNKQQLDTVIQMADRVIQNHWILPALHREVERIVYRRISWDEYFMKLAFLAAERSTCLRHHVGAVIVRNKKILTTGYNGAPSGAEDSLQLGCLRDQLHIPSGERQEVCRATHAEQNTLIQASLHGVSTEGAAIYCTHSPCIICAKLIVNAGIKRVVSCRAYPDETFKSLFAQTKVEYVTIGKPSLVITSLD
jgi:dCMP deaminase